MCFRVSVSFLVWKPFILLNVASMFTHSKGEFAQADSTLSLMILPWLPMAMGIKTKLLTLAFHLGGLPPHCARPPCPIPSVVASDVCSF